MNQWMCDTEKLVNSLHVRMDPNEVKGKVQQVKVVYNEIRSSTLFSISGFQ